MKLKIAGKEAKRLKSEIAVNNTAAEAKRSEIEHTESEIMAAHS